MIQFKETTGKYLYIIHCDIIKKRAGKYMYRLHYDITKKTTGTCLPLSV